MDQLPEIESFQDLAVAPASNSHYVLFQKFVNTFNAEENVSLKKYINLHGTLKKQSSILCAPKSAQNTKIRSAYLPGTDPGHGLCSTQPTLGLYHPLVSTVPHWSTEPEQF